MKKMAKKSRKRYSKKQIEESRKNGDKTIAHELAVKFLKHEKMSRAETEAAASLVKLSRPADSISLVNLAYYPEGQDHIFKTLYLAYYQDLEGQHGIKKFSGFDGLVDRVATIEEKKEDVIRLNEYYTKWEKNFSTNRHKDQILNLIINETNNTDLKEIKKKLDTGEISQTEYAYKKKGTILLSKYLYLKVAQAFEEINADTLEINFGGTIIEITPWSMVHILNRHYASSAKHVDSSKSFHGDPHLKFFEDPEQLKNILEEMGSHPDIKGSDVKFIPLKLNGKIYSIHTQTQKKDNGTSYIRIQTFYPTELEAELQLIQSDYNEVIINSHLVGYQKK